MEADADADANIDADVAEDADTDDGGSNEFNSDADANVNNDTGANTDADVDADDAAICENDACKFVSTVIGDKISCCSVITDDAVKDNVANADEVAATAAASTLSLDHALAFRPRCCPIADAVFFPLFEFKI